MNNFNNNGYSDPNSAYNYGDYNNYGSSYSSESTVITLLKGLLGAIVGAIPGMLLWIIVGKLGFIFSAIGILIAAGSVFGFGFMTKKGNPPMVLGMAICAVVFLLAIFFAVRIEYAWEISSLLADEGIGEFTFFKCFLHLGEIFEMFDLKGEYIWGLIKAELFGLLGGFAILFKRR